MFVIFCKFLVLGTVCFSLALSVGIYNGDIKTDQIEKVFFYKGISPAVSKVGEKRRAPDDADGSILSSDMKTRLRE